MGRQGGSVLGLMVLYTLSGASGLVFEVAYTRIFGEYFGHANLAITVVLAAYMGGMAVGALSASRWSDRVAQPVRLYGVLELGIALWCATAPYQIALSDRLGAALLLHVPSLRAAGEAPRWGLAVLLLLVPTAAMGATLPLLGRAAAPSQGPRSVGLLYGANTVGAVAGALAAGVWMLRWAGVGGTLLAGVAVGALTGLGAFAVGTREVNGPQARTSDTHAGPRGATLRVPPLLWGLVVFVSGFAGLASEVLWSRLLVFVLGASVLSFSLVVASVLAGVGFGSLGAAVLSSRGWARERVVGWVMAAYGCALASSVAVASWVPDLWSALGGGGGTTGTTMARGWLATGAVAFLPSVLLGLIFPLATAVSSSGSVGRSAGRLYTAVTLGNVTGAAAATWIMIPAAGCARSLMALGAACMVCAVAVLGRLRWDGWRLPVVAGFGMACAAAAAIGLVPSPQMDSLFNFRASHGRLLCTAQGSEGTITVHQVSALPTLDRNKPPQAIGDVGYAYRLIAADGTTVAGTSADLRTTQRMQAHIPLLLHGAPKRVLQIGYGSGETSVEVLKHGVSLEVAEINPEIVREANRWFPDFATTGFEKVFGDAKSFVRTTDQTYDVILNDSTYPGVAGASQLYSADHFRACRAHLNPGGVFSTWLPVDLPQETLRMVLATFRSVFPECALWLPSNCLNKHAVLVGSVGGMAALEGGLPKGDWSEAVRKSLEELGYGRPEVLLSARLLDGAQVSLFSEGSRINDDRYPRLEYPVRSGRISGEDFWTETLGALLEACSGERDRPAHRAAAIVVLQGEALFLRGDPDGALRKYREAALAAPDLPGPGHLAQGIRVNQATQHFLEALAAFRAGDPVRAKGAVHRVLGLCPESVPANFEMGRLLIQEGDRRGALPYLETCREAVPPLPELPLMLADAYLDAGRYAEAERLFADALAAGDRRFELLVALADAKKSQGKLSEAEGLLAEALTAKPVDKAAQIMMAEVEAREGKGAESDRRLEAVIERYPDSVLATARLADLRAQAGKEDQAKALWERVLQLDPGNPDAEAYLRARGQKAH